MAENVTITTFLELKDNMSDGLKKVEAALKRLSDTQKGTATSTSKAEDAIARSRMRNAAKAAEFAARQAQKQKAQAERIALAELKATTRAHAASVKSAERAERQKATAAIREQRRVEAARVRASKEAARQQKAVEREQARAKRERADFVGKAGAAMFGKGVGGFAAAAMTSKTAALQLGVIGLVDTIASGITSALSKAFDLVKGFFEKVYTLNKEYQISIRRIAGSLVTMDFVPTFQIATRQAEQLYGTMRDLAAKLPGETKDYMEVFSLALPQALHAGEANLAKFTEKVSKFTAFAMFRNVSDINQVARDMERMIMGKAIGRTRMFNEYLAYMQMATQNLKFGVREFNQLSMPARLELMYKVIDKSAETFGYMVNDADTLEGTFNTLIDQILTVGGKPLFDAALSSLKLMNKMLSDNNSKLTEMVKKISTDLGDALRGAVGLLTGYSDGLSDINSKTLEITGITGVLLDTVLEIVKAFGKVTEAARKAGETKRMEEREVDIQRQREEKVMLELRPDVQEAKKLLPGGYFPGGKIKEIPEKPADVVTPAVAPSKVARAFLAFGSSDPKEIERAAERYPRFAEALKGVPEKIERRYTPEITEKAAPWSFATAETWHKQAVKTFKTLDKAAATAILEERGMTDTAISAAYREAIGPRTMAGMDEGDGKKHKARGAPKGRQTTINDFRFSKFDIRQEFAEGFDPDRIAVAFASDLAQLGEMRMQSAYAPLFAVR